MPTPFLPAPRTWAPGQLIKAPYLRADVSDAVALLAYPPHFSGGQTQSAQSIANASDIRVNIDTEFDDPWNGHEVNVANPQDYYGMFPGWYLAEFSAPLNYTGGNGAAAASISGQQNGGAYTVYGGQRMPCSGTTGQLSQPAAAKLMQMVSTGIYAGGSNDYICGVFNQNSGSAQPLQITASKFPYLTVRWVCANAGTAPLIVPANDSWPVPPGGYITSAFMNKNVRDTINFLTYPPVMEAVYNAGTANLNSQATLPAVGNTLPVNVKVVDNYTAFTGSSHTWTAPVAGRYYSYHCTALAMNTTSVALAAGLTVTSANYNGGSQVTLWGGTQVAFQGANALNAAIVRRQLRLNAGDTVLPAGWQHDSAGTAATVAGSSTDWQPRFIMVWLGA